MDTKDTKLDRYDVHAYHDAWGDGDSYGAYSWTESERHSDGDWVRAEDALELVGRITFLEKRVQELEAANRSLRYNQADDYFEPMGKFSGDY